MNRAYEFGFPYFPYPDSVHNFVCDFQPFSSSFGGKRTYYGLPNNPNYSLGPLAGSGCDTITGSPTLTLHVGEGMLFVYYHAGWQKAFINAQKLKGKNYHLRVTDMLGNVVFNEDGILSPSGAGGAYFTKDLNCSSFSKGMYIVTLQTERERLVKKFVKE